MRRLHIRVNWTEVGLKVMQETIKWLEELLYALTPMAILYHMPLRNSL